MPHPRPSWPRRLRRLCLFLVLGLVTTVGVAWAMEATSAEWGPAAAAGLRPTGEWPFLLDPPWPAVPEDRIAFPGIGRTAMSFTKYDHPGVWQQFDVRVGLPLRALHRIAIGPGQDAADSQEFGLPHIAIGIDITGLEPPRSLAGRRLPLLPIWPGLAFNTLFYALLWWLAFASARMVKHNRRYRRGLCPVCRYDLRADYSGGCSECGWKRA